MNLSIFMMKKQLFLVLSFTYLASSASLGNITLDDTFPPAQPMSLTNIGQGIIGSIPELVSDVFGNVIDINNMPDVEWVPVPKLIQEEGYPVENHYITTEDGYILNMHRIPHSKNSLQNNGEVVYLQHGLLAASSDWVLLGPERGLGYLLADAGYDVWLGNVRGNRYSKNHTTYSVASEEFWNFSWHEIGMIDIPTMIDYVLKMTGKSQLYHVGHSQGTTTFYVMASQRPDYNKKVKLHISLAPIAYMNHLFSPLLRVLAIGTMPLSSTLKLIGQYEFLPSSGFFSKLMDNICDQGLEKVLCKNSFFAMAGFSPNQMNASTIPVITTHYPAGAATKQIVHYGQEINSGRFCQFDHHFSNFRVYGQLLPPQYDLSKISCPTYLIYGSNDWLAADVDVQKLFKQLPNGQELYEVPIGTWNHVDFLFGNDAPEVVYQKVLQIIANN
ncbi:unnamed protein product [Phyllotreta striolata]|uniref:Partial AB-hydrolase lipase domain-containing protein n=1 Tax=Phyllotreta striolata TaxID=444603 RepID=A0A9N9XMW8_PHYSR|nr:unnamed protein product [Phyllotreta striolata]